MQGSRKFGAHGARRGKVWDTLADGILGPRGSVSGRKNMITLNHHPAPRRCGRDRRLGRPRPADGHGIDLVRQDRRMDHPVLGNRRLGQVGQLLRAAPVRGAARPARLSSCLHAGRRLDQGREPLSGAGPTTTARDLRLVRLDAVPLPAGRSARELRIQRLERRSGLGHRAAWPTCPPTWPRGWPTAATRAIAGEDFIYGTQGATRLDLVPLLAWEMLGLKWSRSSASRAAVTGA